MVAGIVDVPGHERFVKNMLAGAGGVDLVLFVVAADEGVMPQTREHLDILDLLHVQKGIVALTKTDLVDHDWLQLVQEEVRDLLAGTRFADAPLIPVSSVTGEGLDELRRPWKDWLPWCSPSPGPAPPACRSTGSSPSPASARCSPGPCSAAVSEWETP